MKELNDSRQQLQSPLTIIGQLCDHAQNQHQGSRPLYQLKITIRDLRPPIWRRVLVPGGFTLYKLHRVIQAAFGWFDDHLHSFLIDGNDYSIPSPDDVEPVIDERRFAIQAIAPGVKRKFLYEYDFGDS